MERPSPLEPSHNLKDFDCGEQALNEYLQKHALQSQRSHGSVTYIASNSNRVIGYYTLLYGSVDIEDAPDRMSKGLGRYQSIPVIVLARLAVDRSFHGKGLGKGLLKDALIRAIGAAEIAGLRAFLVHAKNANARRFYEQFDFETLPDNPFHLYRLINDIKRQLKTKRI